jgi:hypothetical protein
MYADRHRVERSFENGDLVFFTLQPHRKSLLKKSGAEKLKPRLYGPYKVIRRVGEVSYELELPEDPLHLPCIFPQEDIGKSSHHIRKYSSPG